MYGKDVNEEIEIKPLIVVDQNYWLHVDWQSE